MESTSSEFPWLRSGPRKKQHKLKSILRCSTSQRPDGCRPPAGLTDLVEDDDLATLRRKYISIQSYFTKSAKGRHFLDTVLSDIQVAFPTLEHQSIDVLCLGLGNPAVDQASLRQLALLDLLIECDDRLTRSRTRLYDPVFRSVARSFIEQLGMQVISENKEACYALSPDRYHFVMLPHCAPALLNNLLRTNWTTHLLGRLVLFSNGWNQVFLELAASGEPECLVSKELAYMTILRPILSVGNCNRPPINNAKCDEENDFEGMRIQWFTAKDLSSLPVCTWVHKDEPSSADGIVQFTDVCEDDRFQADLISRRTVSSFVDS